MTPRRKRLAWIVAGVAVLATAVGLVLYALSSNIVFFFTPSQVAAKEAPQGRAFRVGGLVEDGSVRRNGLDVSFRITDNARTIPVVYRGTLPDLFKEGKGVVAQGAVGPDGVFKASEVLAKHDENYMPPEAAEALKKAGHPMQSGTVKQP
ncbi:MAG: cytochrome c maturation protein CcmE [Burkholderiales bacterium]|jgi:cytochrome c-type biogenesis protein CcmE|nr:cytochrome c maturation protein CcmE [Burkholderiales bacterium]